MSEFVVPDFLKGQSPEEIHQETIELMPGDIDMSEGGHAYNNTFPVAYHKSMFAQFIMTEAIKLIWPEYCEGYDSQVDYHGKNRGMSRKTAVPATGVIQVTAVKDTVIPKGSLFSTASTASESSVQFATLEAVTYTENGTKTISVEAVNGGASGNVVANSIIINSSSIGGISNVTNPEPTSGGIDEESTIDYIARINEFDKSQGQSFIGNSADYKRWAEEVQGVGHATVIMPSDNSGIVKISITDTDGNNVSDSVCASVYNHIMSPLPLATDGTGAYGTEDYDENRLAPVNARIEVTTPSLEPITISAYVYMDSNSPDSVLTESILPAFLSSVQEYLKTNPSEIILTKIGALLAGANGVADYENITLNGKEENLYLDSDKQATIAVTDITLTRKYKV